MLRILNRRRPAKQRGPAKRGPARHGRLAGLAAVAVGGCLALTACASMQLGAVAVVGGQRITSSTLTTQVAALTRYYDAHKAKVQLQFPISQTAQQVLAWMIRFQVRDQELLAWCCELVEAVFGGLQAPAGGQQAQN